jgi:galactokinase
MPLSTFEELFGRPPSIRAAAPGRVNLMGDHTDYNEGFVLPAAIPQRTEVQLDARGDRLVRIWSDQFRGAAPVEYRLGEETRDGGWADYARGITRAMAEYGPVGGFDARIASTVPVGSGLSSSAAFEIALARAVREAFTLRVSDVDLAKAARRAENEFVGAPVGIMDQMACSLADGASALFLDTRSLEFERVPLPDSAALIVIHSGVSHRHADGGYGTRRRECQDAAAALGVAALRDVSPGDSARLGALPPPLDRRARHVVSENERVAETADALRAGDLARAGRLFLESHQSLRDDFDVSVPEIDALVEIASRVKGVHGVRLTGGGFGGSVVALADSAAARRASVEIADAYGRATGRRGHVLLP